MKRYLKRQILYKKNRLSFVWIWIVTRKDILNTLKHVSNATVQDIWNRNAMYVKEMAGNIVLYVPEQAWQFPNQALEIIILRVAVAREKEL